MDERFSHMQINSSSLGKRIPFELQRLPAAFHIICIVPSYCALDTAVIPQLLFGQLVQSQHSWQKPLQSRPELQPHALTASPMPLDCKMAVTNTDDALLLAHPLSEVLTAEYVPG
jgi:hypothetical protein